LKTKTVNHFECSVTKRRREFESSRGNRSWSEVPATTVRVPSEEEAYD